MSSATGLTWLLAEGTGAAVTTTFHRLELARWGGGWHGVTWVALCGLLIYAACWLYRHEARGTAGTIRRAILGAVRAAVVLLLAFVWLEPVWTTYWVRRHPSYTLVLLDRSASMGLTDGYRDAPTRERVLRFLNQTGAAQAELEKLSRVELAERLVRADGGRFIRALQQRNDVRLLSFADQLLDAEGRANGGAEEAKADGPATDLGQSLRQAVEALGGATVAGVVLLSDGGINRGDSPAAIAAYAKARDIPLFAVGLGDPAEPVNIRVLECEAPEAVFVKDPFEITARLSGYAPEGEPVRVELDELSAGGGQTARRLDSKGVAWPEGQAAVEVRFTHAAQAPGRRQYRVRALPLPAETLTQDNAAAFTVSVQDDKLRVLLVAGAPSWQYHYVTRLLERDRTIDLSCWLQSAGTEAVRDGDTVIDHLPTLPNELFTYDAVLLLDPDPSRLPEGWDRTVQQLVADHGGGLLYSAAPIFTTRFVHDPRGTEIVEVLPVEIGPDSDLLLHQLGLFQQRAWPAAVPPDALDHPVMRLAADRTESAQLWYVLGEVYWHFPVSRAKPVASVLMRHSDPRMANTYGSHVLLAVQPVGLGRTCFIGFDSTWRWRRFGEKYFDRFWVQLVRHLGEGKLLAGKGRVALRTDRPTYQAGEVVTLSARLLDSDYQPVRVPEVEVTVAAEAGSPERVRLAAEPDRPGWFKGRYAPPGVGLYRAVLEATSGPEQPATVSFLVSAPDTELRNPRMDEAALAVIASQSAGGRYVPIDQAMQIPDLIADRHREQVIRGTPQPLWDRWWTLALLVGLLGGEWLMRKRAYLL